MRGVNVSERAIYLLVMFLLTVLLMLSLQVGAAHAAGKPVPRKVSLCQAAQLHGTYRWQCQRPTLRPTGWDLFWGVRP
jgi:hypothetical protein